MANVVVAYALWMLGGLWGLHHLYLGRENQAFLWTISLGGTGFGFWRDFFRIPSYVEEANLSAWYAEDLATKQQRYPRPSMYLSRTFGMLYFGASIGYIFISAAGPLVYEPTILTLLPQLIPGALGAAVGVWLVGSIGEQTGSFKQTLIGACLGQLGNREPWGFNWFSVLGAIGMFYRSRKWRRTVAKKSATRTFGRWLGMLTVYGLLFTSSLYWHGYTNSPTTGEKIYIRDSIHNLLNSDFYRDWNSTEFFERFQTNDWEGARFTFGKAFDPEGERRAYRTLGLEPGEDLAAIKKAHKKMALANHPDKLKGKSPEEVEAAQNRFIEAQAAYDLLMKLKKDRSSRRGRE